MSDDRPVPRAPGVGGSAEHGADVLFGRPAALDRLAGEAFDVLVVGGGVTGAGVALDAASRGLKTALIEKGDFASGTSSKSSKLVHGGLRYLQQREFRLVYENLAERQRLLENAPHLVRPLAFLIPLFGRDGVVSSAVARSYATALWLYDLTGGLRIGKRHRRVDQAEALEHLPDLRTDHLVAGFLYWDARADDARLTVTLLRTAAHSHGAVVANYTAAEELVTDGSGRVVGARVRPRTPAGGSDPEPFEIRARVVVNAGGVWADQVRLLDEGRDPRSLRPAKGIHVTVPASRLPCDIAAVIPVAKDRRSVFVVPWEDADLVYLGTTDTAYEGPLDDPACTPEDVDYLLDAANAVTDAGLTRQDVTAVWAGLRPLLAPRGGRAISERTADLSRRHTVVTSANGLVTVTGGKLTTYRKMAQDTVDQVVARLGGRAAARRSVTRKLRLRGAPGTVPGASAPPDGLDPAVRAHLEGRYGEETARVLALAEGRPELLDPVVEGLAYLGVEVVHAARHEMALTLDDVLSRRTRAVIQDGRATVAAAPRVAALLGAELGWDEQTVADQVAAFSRAVTAELATAGLDPAPPAGRRPAASAATP